jgi:hypothetical protein
LERGALVGVDALVRLAVDELAEPGELRVITRYRCSDVNLRTPLFRIVDRAGVKRWPRPWRNLRATRHVELMRRHPEGIVNQWIGHSQKVAPEYYEHATDADYAAASSTLEVVAEVIASGAVIGRHPHGEPAVEAHRDASGIAERRKSERARTPTTTVTAQERGFQASSGAESVQIPDELVQAWAKLTTADQGVVLGLAVRLSNQGLTVDEGEGVQG